MSNPSSSNTGPGRAASGPGRVESATLDAVFAALAHPARRRVLVTLHARGGRMTAGEIHDRFQHSWPTTSRHLGVLRDAGLVDIGKQGRNRMYSLRRDDLGLVCAWLGAWALATDDPAAERPSWTALPYSTMRNAIPPRAEDEPDAEE